jgi:hypothetical protein
MAPQRLRGVVVLFGLAAWVWGLLEDAHGKDPRRRQVLNAFEELRKSYRASLPDIKVRSVKSTVPGAKGGEAKVVSPGDVGPNLVKVKPAVVDVDGEWVEARNMVKVWAELAATGKKVSLTGYRWKPDERFYLCFETTAPVKFAFHQKFANRPDEQILPTEKHTKSFDTILPGEPYRLPVLLRMLDTDDDEDVSLSVVVVGSGGDPDLDREITVKAARNYCSKMDQLHQEMRTKKLAMSPIDLGREGQPTSDNTDDVALIAVGTGNRGYVELTLRKNP